MTIKNTGNIYIITNNINNKKYIGQTINKLSTRWGLHKHDARYGSNRPLYRAMRKYGIENFNIELIEEVPRESLNEREIFWIKTLNTLVPYGYNLSPGGHSYPSYRMKEVYEVNIVTGEILDSFPSSKEASRVLGINASHNAANPLLKQKMSNGHAVFQRVFYESFPEKDWIEFLHCKYNILYQLNRYNEIENMYLNITEATKSMFNISSSTDWHYNEILRATKTIGEIAFGYRWCFHDTLKENFQYQNIYIILKFNKDDGKYLDYYESYIDAAKSIGKDGKAVPNILRCCTNPNRKTAYGYKWKKIEGSDVKNELCKYQKHGYF